MPETHHLAVAHVQIHAADEFSVRAGRHDDGFSHQYRFGQGVMGMARKDHINPCHNASHLFVHIKAIVAETDHQIGPIGADLIHHRLHILIADTEGILGEHPAGIGDGHIGEGLTNHGNFHPTGFKELIGREHVGRLIPFAVKNILAQSRERQPFDNLIDPLAAQGELPMEGHRIRPQGIHNIDHILPGGFVAGVRAMPSIPPIQQQSIGTLGADVIDDSGDTIQSTNAPIALGQRGKIIIRQRIGRGAAVINAIELAKICPGDMRHLSAIATDTNIDLRFAEEDGFHLSVNICHMDQRDIAEGIKFEQLTLGQGLLCGQPAPVAKARSTVKRGRGHSGLQKITTRYHFGPHIRATYARY